MKSVCSHLFALALLAACSAPVLESSPETVPAAGFGEPRPAVIEGYDGDVMEPFLSRDGETLFFNNSNAPTAQTDLHWATRIDDLHFRYRARIAGANSMMLDGVPTLSRDGVFCFVSTRDYARTLATIHCGSWSGADAANVTLQAEAAPLIPGRLVFDAELDASGQTLLIADGLFTGGPVPAAADLRLARLVDGRFRLDPSADRLFGSINTAALEYAAAISADGLALSFTRLARPPGSSPQIWIARRATTDAAFEAPQRIDAIKGFVEAATFAPDGAIYFHRRVGERHTLWRAAAE
jgi:hypothetical protein